MKISNDKKELFFRASRFSSKSNISQREGNNNRHKGNNSEQIYFSKIHCTFLLNRYAMTNKTIPLSKSSVNITKLDEGSIPGNIGETMGNPNQNTEKFIRKSAATERKVDSIVFISNKFNISRVGI